MSIWAFLCGGLILAAAFLLWSLCVVARYGVAHVEPVRPDTGEYDSEGYDE